MENILDVRKRQGAEIIKVSKLQVIQSQKPVKSKKLFLELEKLLDLSRCFNQF